MNTRVIFNNWRRLVARSFFLLLLVPLLNACQSFPLAKAHQKITAPTMPMNDARGVSELKQGTELSDSIADASPQEGQDAPQPLQDWQVSGTGQFIKPSTAQGKKKVTAPKFSNNRDITLNFENTDIREVVKIVLGDTLKVNYIVDPGVHGGVSMQTGAPVSRKDLLPLLETLLRMNNATLVHTGNTYHVVPVTKANKGLLTPQLADAQLPLPSGHNLIIRPLRNIGADEMNDILKPLVRDHSIVRVDNKRNLLILSGSAQDMQQMMEIIDTFDVNWVKGLSVGFFALENGSVDQVQQDLDAVLGGDTGKALGGLVRITPIESANGFLVVSAHRQYLEEVGKWIKRFDSMAQSGEEQRLFVYRVRNGKAEDLAGLLNELFTGKSAKPKTKPGSVAPGLKGTTVASKSKNSKTAAEKAKKPKVAAKKPAAASSGKSSALEGEIRVVADEDHNTLLILASPRDYKRILGTLEQLDIVPLQVHIEATIVEVLLKDKLKYGISWFFQGGAGGNGRQSIGGVGGSTSGTDISGGLSSLLNGFNWSLIDSTGAVKAVLNAFANDSLVNVLSAPSVMVLDNHEAKIRVGDEVPTLTQSQANDAGNILQTVQYRETGIILTVKPRVNPGGLVTMEVTQEVSAVADTEIQTNQPTIQTREINSTVAVQSGQTVVLGGLIRDKRTNSEGGVPFIYKVPVLGALFGETENGNERVELVIVLTPRVITSAEDALRITRDFRTRMQGLKQEFLEEAGVIRDNGGERVYGTSVNRTGNEE
ncbi:type II secretion system secretin GspD [Thiolapillus brandeum]|uniref:General secretion pathway protein D n=1 Tax=Thiolapillus brandeum TaxID=1076588 RepID=A0A7U6GGU9_9GAMM|nr:type II secretion system secretin GspD [Thiolapillus brandeum]BAO43428.1 general secretion pathway protein D [Thiolapillus brandeum]